MEGPDLHYLHVWFRRAGLFIVVVGLAGCGDLGVLLGLRTRLDKLPVTSISASLVGKNGSQPITSLPPGGSAWLVVVATTEDGKRLVTAGAGHGTVLLDSFSYTPTLAQIKKNGKVSLPADPRLTDGQIASIHLATVGHADVVTDLHIPIRYDVPFAAKFLGASGSKGLDGLDGTDGLSGSDALPSPPDPTTGLPGAEGPGGNGSNGGNGGDGGNGSDGEPGPHLHVWMRLESGSDHLLQAKVSDGKKKLFYLVDANGGSLKVTADGGAGGAPGRGGRAGPGGAGGFGNPNGFSGLDGLAGSDGRPGSDGAAGTIAVSVDPAAQPFKSILVLSNHSGSGQQGPAPTFTVESVAPLW
jgi:hypothetical protein